MFEVIRRSVCPKESCSESMSHYELLTHDIEIFLQYTVVLLKYINKYLCRSICLLRLLHLAQMLGSLNLMSFVYESWCLVGLTHRTRLRTVGRAIVRRHDTDVPQLFIKRLFEGTTQKVITFGYRIV